jgi:hypothetical protein
MQIKNLKEKLLGLSIILSIIAFIDIVFRPPSNVERFIYENIPLDKIKPREIKIPELPKLETYLKPITQKKIFEVSRKAESEPQLVTNIHDYEFNGVVSLDKLYVAIFKKSTQEQFIVAEGGVLDGIKVNKIDRSFVIIELYGEERKIMF